MKLRDKKIEVSGFRPSRSQCVSNSVRQETQQICEKILKNISKNLRNFSGLMTKMQNLEKSSAFCQNFAKNSSIFDIFC